MIPSQELTELNRQVRNAAAALQPLTSGFTHDGRRIPGADDALATARAAIYEAVRLVKIIEAKTDDGFM